MLIKVPFILGAGMCFLSSGGGSLYSPVKDDNSSFPRLQAGVGVQE